MNRNRIITISREFGSGGRELGRRLAEAMQIAYYDREIVQTLIGQTKQAEAYIRYMEQERPLPLLPITTARTFGMPTNQMTAENLHFYMQESKAIQQAAEKSDCVVVGRCSDYILREFKPLKLFVYAEMEHKIARCREKKPDETRTDRQMARMIKNIDKHRAKYYEFFTARRWGNKRLYDICINTSEISVKDVASVLADYVHLWNPSEN